MEKFEFSEIQAQAILDLRLRALTALERQQVEKEYADLAERIAELRDILGDPAKIDGVIRDELLEIKQIYGRNDDRRTEIIAAEEELELEDMIAEEDMVIAITRSGYIKRLPVTAYREQRRGGIGVMGMELKEDDYIEHLFVASTHDYILFFTNVGKVYRLKVHELPLGSRQSKGARSSTSSRSGRTRPCAPSCRRATSRRRSTSSSRRRTASSRRRSSRRTTRRSRPTGSSRSRCARATSSSASATRPGNDDILMVSKKGQAIRFHETDARPMGRDTEGVKGMTLRAGDEVISLNIAEDDADLLVVTENGYGKRTRVSEYPVKGRGGWASRPSN
jgi:DNA gyrase subunit A